MSAYYNEIDPDAAHILRALIADGVIAPGDVDTRSIKEVQPDDLRPYTQCHFFAGGGLWSVAARMAGWDDDRPLWTGSCPCQPFSHAGKGGGIDDPRHLWPDFFRLIRARRPAVVVGEQVAGQAGYGWFDGVSADLAGEAFASRTVDIPACSVDAPHIRQRLYWVALADAPRVGCQEAFGEPGDGIAPNREGSAGRAECPHRADGLDMDDAQRERFHRRIGPGGAAGAPGTDQGEGLQRERVRPDNRKPDGAGGGDVGNAASGRREQRIARPATARHGDQPAAAYGRNGSWWSDHEWISCHDGKARRAQPGVPMLVDGLPGRVGLWRVAGNAISPVLAAEVIGALMDTLDRKDIAA